AGQPAARASRANPGTQPVRLDREAANARFRSGGASHEWQGIALLERAAGGPAGRHHSLTTPTGSHRMTPPAISRATLTTALGAGNTAHLSALEAGRTGLAPCSFADVRLPGYVGEVAGVDAVGLPPGLADFDCRNNRLAWLGLQQDGFIDQVRAARERWGERR